MSIFSEKLKALRLSRQKQQKELAELLEITIRQYQRYESGEQEPSIDKLTALARHFNVSVDYLLGLSDNPQTSYAQPNSAYAVYLQAQGKAPAVDVDINSAYAAREREKKNKGL